MVGSDETSPENNLTTSITIDGHSGSVRYTLYRLTAPSFSSELKDIELTAEEPKTVDNGFPISVRNQSALILEMTLAPGGVGPAPEPACTPDCTGKECGSDGCEGTCGTCLSTETCSASQICVPVETSCTPACSGKECGSDGCGGSCGTCSSTETCNSSHICALLPTPAGTTGSSGSTGTSGSSGTSGTTGASGTSGTGSTTGTTDVLVPPSELDLPTYTGSTADDTSGELPDNNEAPSGITGTDMQTLPDTGILTNHPLLTFGIFCSLASLLLWLSIPSFQTHVLQKTTRKEEQRARTLREKHTQQQYFEQQVLRKVPQENTSKRQ